MFAALTAMFVMATHARATTQADATKIQQQWQEAIQAWAKQATDANTPEQRENSINSRPDAASYADKMWHCIATSLDKEWTLEPAAWLLVMVQELPPTQSTTQVAWNDRTEAIRKAIIAHHLNSTLLTPVCMALARLADPHSLSILEKIEKSNPDPRVQGVAALGASIIIKGLGDDPELMRKRLTYLRKAIIESADVQIGQTTVANLAENELYQIRFLSKGRIAPDIQSTDSAKHPIRLSDFKGKVVVLVFWSSTIPQYQHTLAFTSEMVRKFSGKPIEVIGVNHDPLTKLRAMVSDETVTWRNFSDPDKELAQQYRIGVWPTVYVLDGQRRIQYAGTLGTFAELTAEALASEGR